MTLYENDYFNLILDQEKVYIKIKQHGFLLKDFDIVIRHFPRIKLMNFNHLKNSFTAPIGTVYEIGDYLPVLVLEIAPDAMSASITINENKDYIERNEQKIVEDIRQLLKNAKIIHGIKELNLSEIVVGKATLIAQGTPPIKGQDAKVKYYEIPDKKPSIEANGKANYFDLNFICEIQEGSWLGEKIHLQSGIKGKNVMGEPVSALPGSDAVINYDSRSCYLVEEENRTLILSKISGVLEKVQGVLVVNEHLVIDGDVGPETGNIVYDGTVTVKGTVLAGYSVNAKGDIFIEGVEGISAAKEIQSYEGDIYVRGGVFGLGKTMIQADGEIYIKHVNDASIIAKGDIHIGFYCLGSVISGQSVFLDDKNGKIIGGKTVAKQKISTAYCGNETELRTELIIVNGNKVDYELLIKEKAIELASLQKQITSQQEQLEKIRVHFVKLSDEQKASYEKLKQVYEKNNDNYRLIDQEIRLLMIEVANIGEEEISIHQEAYPGTYIQIGKKATLLKSKVKGTIKVEYGELNV